MAMEQWKVNEEVTLTWLDGGVTHLDGGAMFGVVPKPLWSKRYPVNDKNQIELRSDPILLQVDGKHMLIESGIGNGKFSEKAMRNYGITSESRVRENLAELGLTPSDIDAVLMTHMHFDHVSGLTEPVDGKQKPVFENAVIYVEEKEWAEMKAPNIRSRNTYFRENWEAIEHQVKTYGGQIEVAPEIRMIHTGGHSYGHAIIHIGRGNADIWHMADLMPTHAHLPSLWVLAYDDYPMTSIEQKERYIQANLKKQPVFTFYHDAHYRFVQFSEDGKRIEQCLERNRENE